MSPKICAALLGLPNLFSFIILFPKYVYNWFISIAWCSNNVRVLFRYTFMQDGYMSTVILYVWFEMGGSAAKSFRKTQSSGLYVFFFYTKHVLMYGCIWIPFRGLCEFWFSVAMIVSLHTARDREDYSSKMDFGWGRN